MKAICTTIALVLLAGAAYAEETATPVEADVEESTETAEHRDRVAAARERMAEASREMAEASRKMAEAVRERQVWRMERAFQRAFLGIFIAEQGEDGIRVAGLSPEGGAEEAGIVVGDVIVAINGESLVGDDEPVAVLHEILEDVDAGDAVELVVLRDDETIPLEVVTTAHVSDIGRMAKRLGRGFRDFDIDWRERRPGRRDGPGRDGLRLVDIGEDLGDYFGVDAGVLVLDTPAKSAFTPGDIVKRIDGAAVSSAADGYHLLRRLTAEAQAEVRRKNRKVMVDVAPAPEREHRRVIVVDSDEHEEHEEE